METTAITLIFLIVLIILFSVLIALFTVNKSKKREIEELNISLEQADTRLKKFEKDLHVEREKLNTILVTTGVGIIVLDGERRVTMLNKTAATLFRIATEAAMGMPFINLARDHEMDVIVQRCLETNQQQTGAVQPAGSRQYLELTASPLSDGALILVQDMTNIRRLEKMRQDFIANISHELRTPIASCKAIVETLQNGAIYDTNIAGDFLQRMHIEIDKLAQMVNELG